MILIANKDLFLPLGTLFTKQGTAVILDKLALDNAFVRNSQDVKWVFPHTDFRVFKYMDRLFGDRGGAGKRYWVNINENNNQMPVGAKEGMTAEEALVAILAFRQTVNDKFHPLEITDEAGNVLINEDRESKY